MANAVTNPETKTTTLFDYFPDENNTNTNNFIPIAFEPKWDVDSETVFEYKNIKIVNCDMFDNNVKPKK